MKLLHLGIPTQEKIEGKTYAYVERIKLHVTNPEQHDLKLQFVCAEKDSPLPEIVRTKKHLAIEVENMEAALKKFDEVVFPPTVVTDKLKICFALREDILFELTEFI